MKKKAVSHELLIYLFIWELKKKRILSLDSLYSKLLTTNEKKEKQITEAIIKRKLSYSCKLKGD